MALARHFNCTLIAAPSTPGARQAATGPEGPSSSPCNPVPPPSFANEQHAASATTVPFSLSPFSLPPSPLSPRVVPYTKLPPPPRPPSPTSRIFLSVPAPFVVAPFPFHPNHSHHPNSARTPVSSGLYATPTWEMKVPGRHRTPRRTKLPG